MDVLELKENQRKSGDSPRHMAGVQAIILVGGEGTRLRPLTYQTPKPMVPIAGVPFLARSMERLYDAGITDVVLAAGYMPKAITDYFGDGSALDMRITYAIEDTPLGTAGALKNCESHITGPFFVFNGDILTSLDLCEMMRHHQNKGGAGTLHLIEVEDPSAFGVIVHDEAGLISAFVEKPPKDQAPSKEINAGTYLLEKDVLSFIPVGRAVSIERETFPQLIAAGKKLYSYTTNDYWIDLGRPENYLAAHRDLLSGTMPLLVEPGITGAGAKDVVDLQSLVPPVHLEAGVMIDPKAVVGPNVVLGSGCRIGPGAVVQNSVLWEDVVVGPEARIEQAIIASGASIGRGAKVGSGSVIGHGVAVEDGAELEPGSRLPLPAG